MSLFQFYSYIDGSLHVSGPQAHLQENSHSCSHNHWFNIRTVLVACSVCCGNSCVSSPEDGPVGPKHVEIRQYMNKIEIVTSVGFYSICWKDARYQRLKKCIKCISSKSLRVSLNWLLRIAFFDGNAISFHAVVLMGECCPTLFWTPQRHYPSDRASQPKSPWFFNNTALETSKLAQCNVPHIAHYSVPNIARQAIFSTDITCVLFLLRAPQHHA